MERPELNALNLSASEQLELSALDAKINLKVMEYYGEVKGAPSLLRDHIETLEKLSTWERGRNYDGS